MNPDWRARYDLAVEVADEAARIAAGFFPDGDPADFAAQVEWKLDRSPVTAGDRAAEAFLRNRIINAFPNDAFLGEEYGEKPGDSGFRWVVDPIDGTRNFMRGMPLWGTLVGLEYRGEADRRRRRHAGAGLRPTGAARRRGLPQRPAASRLRHGFDFPTRCSFCSSLSGFFEAGARRRFWNWPGGRSGTGPSASSTASC